jgi:mRNA interferase MazF
MITSNMARSGHASRVTVLQTSADGQQMGLHTDSVIMTDNLATVLENEIDRSIGHCPIMDSLDDALRHTLGL